MYIEGMFGFAKNKKSKTDKQKKPKNKKLQASSSGGKSEGQRLREEALANARAARENLGDETVQKIAKIMQKMETQPMKKAQEQIANADAARVADEILYMLEQRKKNRLN